MGAYETFVVERRDGVATVTLNRPAKLNAIDMRMARELYDLVPELQTDSEVGSVVLTGAGRAFCGGGDVRDLFVRMEGASLREREELIRFFDLLMLRFITLEKPTIAAVNGLAVGGGFNLALGCDLRIASTDASFCQIFVKRGLTAADLGGTYLLPRVIGLGRAYELLLTGKTIDATTAERIGLVNRVVAPADLTAQTHTLATELAAGPPLALALTKRAVLHGLGTDLTSDLEFEAAVQTIAFDGPEHREGYRSFLEKRPPTFPRV
ncbi:MAG: enoyl-CoA hydratase/isomerase family protein [Chloroflexi bacterium]|nr:enoyl-CoA hydratase/isomerase family protein [Chloroflexota bacterium]